MSLPRVTCQMLSKSYQKKPFVAIRRSRDVRPSDRARLRIVRLSSGRGFQTPNSVIDSSEPPINIPGAQQIGLTRGAEDAVRHEVGEQRFLILRDLRTPIFRLVGEAVGGKLSLRMAKDPELRLAESLRKYRSPRRPRESIRLYAIHLDVLASIAVAQYNRGPHLPC